MKWIKGLLDEEPKPAKPVFTEEERRLGISEESLAFVTELARIPMTWIEFPLDVVLEQQRIVIKQVEVDDKDDDVFDEIRESLDFSLEEEELRKSGLGERKVCPVPLVLNDVQTRHAELMLGRCKELAKLRHQLCPRVIDDDLFWAIYFVLIKQHLCLYKDVDPDLVQDELEEPEKVIEVNERKDDILRTWAESLNKDTHTIYKLICRMGLPPQLRLRVWSRLLVLEGEQHVLEEQYERVFGKVIPNNVAQMPRFQCPLQFQNVVTFFGLDRFTTKCVRRLLSCLALEMGHLNAPLLPVFVVALFSIGFSESRVLDSCLRLLRTSVSAVQTFNISLALIPTRDMHHNFHFCLLEKLIQIQFPQLHSRMNFLGIEAKDFASRWYNTFFFSVFNEKMAVLNVMDRWLYNGWNAMHSMALSILFTNCSTLTQCETKEQFLMTVGATEKRCAPALLRVAHAMRVKKKVSLFHFSLFVFTKKVSLSVSSFGRR